MHPSYINDYIDKIKSEVNTDLDILQGAVKEIIKNKNKYEALEYEWHVAHVTTNAHLYKHALYNLYKILEKETDAGKSV